MKTTEFRCDLCGEPAGEWWRILRHDLVGARCGAAHDVIEMDLCPACAERVRALMENGDDTWHPTQTRSAG